jgi:hypothetical protein
MTSDRRKDMGRDIAIDSTVFMYKRVADLLIEGRGNEWMRPAVSRRRKSVYESGVTTCFPQR